jgi:glycosyltransferase involved in cell wall biosynthesis
VRSAATGFSWPTASAPRSRQEGVGPEVIVVDDATTDDSAAVAQQFADGAARVSVLRHQQKSGHIITFNDAYAEATGEFIVRLDADDMRI